MGWRIRIVWRPGFPNLDLFHPWNPSVDDACDRHWSVSKRPLIMIGELKTLKGLRSVRMKDTRFMPPPVASGERVERPGTA
ncbi:MAG: hypothetical protein CM1200mP18_21320 [Gammaproteobacteria bacterium]|nr:MAG: hypothetical protein CM1200mP18_21320 [Gammaproteobacteria bacterium]